jgi:hypothetical protein
MASPTSNTITKQLTVIGGLNLAFARIQHAAVQHTVVQSHARGNDAKMERSRQEEWQMVVVEKSARGCRWQSHAS